MKQLKYVRIAVIDLYDGSAEIKGPADNIFYFLPCKIVPKQGTGNFYRYLVERHFMDATKKAFRKRRNGIGHIQTIVRRQAPENSFLERGLEGMVLRTVKLHEMLEIVIYKGAKITKKH